MRVNLLSTYYPNYKSNNRNINFASNTNIKESSENKESLLEIKNKVDALMNQNKAQTISAISSYAINQFKSDMQIKLNNTNKFDNIRNKVKILDQISDSYIRQSDFEKALAITIQTIKEINENKILSSDEKKKLILSPEHWYAIRRYSDSVLTKIHKRYGNGYKIKHNSQLLLSLVKTIKEINYEEFMPYIEYLIDNIDKSESPIDAEIDKILRDIINQNYDLSVLDNFIKKNDEYTKECCATILGKWGQDKDIKILKETLTNKTLKTSVIKKILEAIGNIGGTDSLDILKPFAVYKPSFWEDSKKELREIAINNIAKSKDSPNYNFLKSLYQQMMNDKDYSSYETILDALTSYKNLEILNLLEDNLYNSKPSIVINTLKKMGDIKSDLTTNILMEYLNTNPPFLKFDEQNNYRNLLSSLEKQDLNHEQIEQIKNKFKTILKDNPKLIDKAPVLVTMIEIFKINEEESVYEEKTHLEDLIREATWNRDALIQDYVTLYGQYHNLSLLNSLINDEDKFSQDYRNKQTLQVGTSAQIIELLNQDSSYIDDNISILCIPELVKIINENPNLNQNLLFQANRYIGDNNETLNYLKGKLNYLKGDRYYIYYYLRTLIRAYSRKKTEYIK